MERQGRRTGLKGNTTGTQSGRGIGAARQRGGLTIFAAVVLLALMTLMVVYATRTSQSEQRISANDVRQKLAFQAAEVGAQQGLEYLLANNLRILSGSAAAQPDGAGGFRAGWFEPTSPRWVACPPNPPATHPCGGDIAAGGAVNSYFYDDPTTTTAGAFDSLPLNAGVLPPDTAMRVSAVLCPVALDNPAGGCLAAPLPGENTAQWVYVLTLLSYGYSDCENINDLATCKGQATIANPLSNFNIADGSPAAPLTTKTTFPPTGTAEVVPNPNGGGVGVPVSVWANSNPSCSSGAPALANGSWATCEYHEWYERDYIPGQMGCDRPSCSCAASEAISYTAGTNDFFGIDLLEDSSFPCDLFLFFFGVPSSEYQLVKASAKVVPDCDGLDANSFGVYWVSGTDCTFGGGAVVGSPDRPVMIISAAETTNFSGNGTFYGVIFITDVEVPTAEWNASGTNTVYGAVIVDAALDAFVGTFQIVYNEDASVLAASSDGLGTLSGGWRDFGLPTLTWEA